MLELLLIVTLMLLLQSCYLLYKTEDEVRLKWKYEGFISSLVALGYICKHIHQQQDHQVIITISVHLILAMHVQLVYKKISITHYFHDSTFILQQEIDYCSKVSTGHDQHTLVLTTHEMHYTTGYFEWDISLYSWKSQTMSQSRIFQWNSIIVQ